ncbi:MAG TPA: ECF-type sigma factor, partial [Vicinamibacterales bacterium]|nr:ECF-type sigma factor [Vicinamibacterales bacterium]
MSDGDDDLDSAVRPAPPADGFDAERLLPLVYTELRRLAHHYLRRERSDHTLQATALVHEVYL